MLSVTEEIQEKQNGREEAPPDRVQKGLVRLQGLDLQDGFPATWPLPPSCQNPPGGLTASWNESAVIGVTTSGSVLRRGHRSPSHPRLKEPGLPRLAGRRSLFRHICRSYTIQLGRIAFDVWFSCVELVLLKGNRKMKPNRANIYLK